MHRKRVFKMREPFVRCGEDVQRDANLRKVVTTSIADRFRLGE